MSSTATSASTFTAILHLEINRGPGRLRPREIAWVMEDLGWLIGAAGYVAQGEPTERVRGRHRPQAIRAGELVERERQIRQLEPVVVRVEYGSPFVSLLTVGHEAVDSAGGLAFLYFAIKYIFKIDLVVKTERAAQKALLFKAEARAKAAEQRLEEIERHPVSSAVNEVPSAAIIAEAGGWSADLTDEIKKRRRKMPAKWSGSATLYDDEDEV